MAPAILRTFISGPVYVHFHWAIYYHQIRSQPAIQTIFLSLVAKHLADVVKYKLQLYHSAARFRRTAIDLLANYLALLIIGRIPLPGNALADTYIS